MPNPSASRRHQYAVMAPSTGHDSYGEPTVGEAREIMVRWEWGRRESLDPLGNTIALDANVVVGEDIPIDSIMWEGRLIDFLGTGSGDPEAELLMVATFSKTPNIKNRNIRRVCGLVRYKGTMPRRS